MNSQEIESGWLNTRTGRGATLGDVFKGLTPQQILGAEYAIRLVRGIDPLSKRKLREYHEAVCELLPPKKKRPKRIQKSTRSKP